MGYYSSFEIRVEDRRPTPAEILSDLAERYEDMVTLELAAGADVLLSEEDVKWYEWREHVRQFSEEHPGILFTAKRVGEGGGDDADVEVAYFLDGKYQGGKAELKLPELDESKWSGGRLR